MKHITYFLLLLSPLLTRAQNHVPNGDFEEYSTCPSTFAQTMRCTGWKNLSMSPDYFNSCSSGIAGVPSNAGGYQQAANGNGYMGVIFSSGSFGGTTREIISRRISPLKAGKTYEVSLSVSKSNNAKYGSDNLGIFFYDTIGTVTTGNVQSIQPQITFQTIGIISDTVNWIRLTAIFLADSAYDNIAIGGFLDNNNINVTTLNSFGGHPFAYYYIDSVVVSPHYFYHISSNDTNICAGDSILINYYTDIKFNTNNIFTAQLSDANGSFSNPYNIGVKTDDSTGVIVAVIPDTVTTGAGYKIRLLSSAPWKAAIAPKTFRIGNLDSSNVIINISSTPPCLGDTLFIDNNSTPTILQYIWTGPNNFQSAFHSPFIPNTTLANSGSYYLTSHLYGCEILDTLQVQIKPVPVAPVASSNTPLCKYDTLSLSASSPTNGITYSWIGPNGYASNQQNPTRLNTPLNAGGYYNAIATLNGCSSYDTIAVTVKDAPDSVTLSNNSPLCTDDTLKLYADSSAGNVLYSWAGPNSFTSSANDTMIINAGFVNTGWYTMTANLNGCIYTDSTYAVVYQTPSAPTLSYNNPLCIGEQLNLNASSLVSGVTYSWTGPSSFSSTLKSPTITTAQLSNTGNYTATVNYNGCTSPISTLNVSVKPTPFVVISTPSDTICNGTNVTYMAIPANASTNLSYTWKVNAQPQSATGTTFSTTSLNNNDIVLCEMTDNSQCSSPVTDQSNQIKMTVLPWLAPSVSIAANPTGVIIPWDYVQFTATPVNAGSNPLYQWKRNGKDIIGATSNIWSANNLNDNDTIHVELISSYKCPQPTTAKSNSIVVRIATGINEVKDINQLTLAPNPNNGQFTLSGQVNSNGVAKIQVINMLGQVMHKTETKITNQTLKQNIQLENAASGLYLLQLSIDDERAQIKFRVD